MYSKANKRN